jgi:hypothetical protein
VDGAVQVEDQGSAVVESIRIEPVEDGARVPEQVTPGAALCALEHRPVHGEVVVGAEHLVVGQDAGGDGVEPGLANVVPVDVGIGDFLEERVADLVVQGDGALGLGA